MFKKKGAPSAKSLDFGIDAPQIADQNCAGNSPVNKQGQVTDKAGVVLDWPNTPAVHDRDDSQVSSFAYDNSQSLDEGSN